MLRALQFFQRVYGMFPVKQFYATEIPYDHGEAFPGLVHLALSTFVTSADDGFDEFFRAHEVAHQWWAIGVDYATYHDRWLSEGFASFSGLWYMQTARKQNKLYFSMLDRWRADIFLHRGEDESLAFGDRVGDATDAADYQTIVYEKGAWLVHMLRVLMLDLKTMNEDRFTSGMREFYAIVPRRAGLHPRLPARGGTARRHRHGMVLRRVVRGRFHAYVQGVVDRRTGRRRDSSGCGSGCCRTMCRTIS